MTVRLDYGHAMELRRDDEANRGSSLLCRRCGLVLSASVDRYDDFEQMHYVCFHYEFETLVGQQDAGAGSRALPSGSRSRERRCVSTPTILRRGRGPTHYQARRDNAVTG